MITPLKGNQIVQEIKMQIRCRLPHFVSGSKARVGKKPTSLFSGYDAAVAGGALPCSAEELAELLNEHKQRNQGSPGMVMHG
jgi:hypothetical protein